MKKLMDFIFWLIVSVLALLLLVSFILAGENDASWRFLLVLIIPLWLFASAIAIKDPGREREGEQ